MPAASKHDNSDPQNLTLNIYAAMLGDRPAFDRNPASEKPNPNARGEFEARLQRLSASPFFRPTLRDHVERVAAYAARAIDEARDRLAAARPKKIETLSETPSDEMLKPIVLVGPAARRMKTAALKASRAA